MILAVSDVVWQAVIGAVVTLVLAWLGRQNRIEAKADAAAAATKVEEVKETLEEKNAESEAKLDGIAKTGELTHELVNGAMSAQLQIAAVALRRVAELTQGKPGHEKDAKAAELAEKAHAEHEAKRTVVAKAKE